MAYVKPEEIVENMLQAGAKKAGLSVKNLLLRGFLAGAFLGYATTLAILAATQTGFGIVGALVFPVGFVMIVLLGLELATGNFALIPIAVKDKRARIGALLYNWTWVLIGNLIGSISYAFLYMIVTTKMGHIDPSTIAAAQRLIDIAETKTLGYAQYDFDGTISAFTSALLCNWMVTLGAVMAFTSTTTSGKVIAMWLPIMTFFALGYEHAIVNMFLIPAGIMLGANITIAEWWLWNGLPVIAGNIVGGMLFTGFMLYWAFNTCKKNHY
ncbi:MAG: formate/nitrite transporter family protein [Burkholderiales bacterium]|uniref:formate/nitrite transporter family protein n=1 Tax=Nitrosomonas sp. TaxID=42353 RepID=UPI001D40D535|nr:formate/nitrite transporter family protein [Nitrosomonas sp.]MCB1947682.1 formate/nitrite transporter family protein [Nitrosomonas sp.]MCP5242767.1 formate/nitrite transporter family protein [Burkholderiales bacterium]